MILSDHIDREDVDNLVVTIEAMIEDSPEIRDALLEIFNLQPTSRVATPALAAAAVAVLIAHEIGQEVGS